MRITRPAVRRSCRRCHEILSGPLERCWTCGAAVAGVRWGRLALRLALLVVLGSTAAIAVGAAIR